MDTSSGICSAPAQKPGRTAAFDCLRAVACICIIMMHTARSTELMYTAQMMIFSHALVCRIAINIQYWAVPGFIMVTGALLLRPEKEISYQKLFSRYIARVVKAIVVFGALFAVLEAIFNPPMRTAAAFLGGIYEIFTGDTWSHMWYLYCLLGLYLLLPAYKKIAALSGERDIRYLLIVYGVFESLLPLLDIWSIPCGFYIHVSTIYPFWLFLGYYLYNWGGKIPRGVYAAMAVGATAALAVLTYVRLWYNVAVLDIFFSYSSILVIIQAAGAAGWFFRCSQEGFPRVKRVLSRIDGHSFGIYLIHMAYVRLLYKHLHFDPYRLGLAGIPGMLLVVAFAFVMAWLTDVVMKKAPVFKSIV